MHHYGMVCSHLRITTHLCLAWPPSTKRGGQRQQFLHRLFDPPGKHDILLFNFLLWCCLCFDPSFCRLICILVADVSTSGNSALVVELVLLTSHQDFFSPSIGTRVSRHRIPVVVTGTSLDALDAFGNPILVPGSQEFFDFAAASQPPLTEVKFSRTIDRDESSIIS
ncbi:hypothetical protein CY34DRAFT_17123 [Suillus luteus UH-Slu-Lm8-n1]|uniref:Uncharacterized protein n=1 Tax=Suillus luteus UH-Slu-Lm8-n1 TaxID=930992 RepID=A0A0D0AB13_9AGAM|nr:hypothetical protein CY34DRAFT_17123 [Suillus luteus UH-Slu-Lm8-n1]